MRFLNFPEYTGLDNKAFYAAIGRAIDAAFDPFESHATIGRFQSVGDLIENGWSNPEEANGEAYLRRVAAAGRTGVLRRVYPLLAPKVQQVRSVYSARHK